MHGDKWHVSCQWVRLESTCSPEECGRQETSVFIRAQTKVRLVGEGKACLTKQECLRLSPDFLSPQHEETWELNWQLSCCWHLCTNNARSGFHQKRKFELILYNPHALLSSDQSSELILVYGRLGLGHLIESMQLYLKINFIGSVMMPTLVSCDMQILPSKLIDQWPMTKLNELWPKCPELKLWLLSPISRRAQWTVPCSNHLLLTWYRVNLRENLESV